jgi:hypothetical protein
MDEPFNSWGRMSS